MEAIHKLFLRNIGHANGIDREQLVFGSNHRHRSRNILCVDKLLDRRANGRVPRLSRKLGGKSESRQEQ